MNTNDKIAALEAERTTLTEQIDELTQQRREKIEARRALHDRLRAARAALANERGVFIIGETLLKESRK